MIVEIISIVENFSWNEATIPHVDSEERNEESSFFMRRIIHALRFILDTSTFS
jgi:hypothetical protein